MTTFKIEGLLAGMVGKLYSYNGIDHRILRFFTGQEKNSFIVITDKKDITVKSDNAKQFFEDCLFIDETDPFVAKKNEVASLPARLINKNNERMPVVLPKTLLTSNAERLSEIIFNNIESVQKDPAFIPQAQAIVESTKLFIDLAKAEVELIKAVSR